jgi:hypothetical protein
MNSDLKFFFRSDAYGWFTCNQVNNKKNFILNKTEHLFPQIIELKKAQDVRKDAENYWNEPEIKRYVFLGVCAYNTVNVLGAIPIIGTIVGIAKYILLLEVDKQLSITERTMAQKKNEIFLNNTVFLNLMLKALEENKSFITDLKARAIVEMTSCACILFIPDLIAFTSRILQKQEENISLLDASV